MQIALKSQVLWVSLLLAIVAAGCTPPQARQRIAAFASATTMVSENVAEAFQQVDEAFIATAADEAVLKVRQGEKTNPKAVAQPFLAPEEYAARAAVLRALSGYASLLLEIMGDKPQQALDAQVDKFTTSLKSLLDDKSLQGMLGSKQVLSNEEIGMLATAINGIARLAIDIKRTREVKRVIGDTDVHVQQICELLQKDIGAVRDVRGLRSQLYTAYDKRIQDRFDWIAAHSKSTDRGKPVLSPVEQRAEILAWLAMVQDQEGADATMERIYRSLGTLRSAHASLLTAFDDSAPELEELIGLLRAEADWVRHRFDTLKK